MTGVEEAARAYLATRVALLTKMQKAFYDMLYPSGPTWDQLRNASDQVERTLLKNEGKIPASVIGGPNK